MLVLGDFGTGKTYLLYALAQALAPAEGEQVLVARDCRSARVMSRRGQRHRAHYPVSI